MRAGSVCPGARGVREALPLPAAGCPVARCPRPTCESLPVCRPHTSICYPNCSPFTSVRLPVPKGLEGCCNWAPQLLSAFDRG